MKKMSKILLSIGAFFIVTVASLSAQGITTASAYFKSISEYYGTIKDYEVNFEINIEKQESAGTLSFKSPDLLRMDYSNPNQQVIVYNGDTLTIYLPNSNAILQQQITQENSGSSMATPQGLSLLSRYYTVQYETGQNPEPLEEGSDEMVIKFVLYRKNNSEAFKSINIAVNAQTKLIRRILAVTPKGEQFSFDFLDYKLNQDISDQRFVYEAPSSANNYNNFLFSE